jgi:flagellar hook-basal body complex protein FliE
VETGFSGISGVIDTSKIEAMVAQLKAAAATASGETAPADAASMASASAQGAEAVAPRVDFANVLKTQLDNVAAMHEQSAQQAKAYSMGDNSVSLSDLMISGQKASIALQATIQVRNKILSAYTEIMNMQV